MFWLSTKYNYKHDQVKWWFIKCCYWMWESVAQMDVRKYNKHAKVSINCLNKHVLSIKFKLFWSCTSLLFIFYFDFQSQSYENIFVHWFVSSLWWSFLVKDWENDICYKKVYIYIFNMFNFKNICNLIFHNPGYKEM